MSQIAGPYGLRVAKNLGEQPFSGGMHTYLVTTPPAQGLFFGDPVGLSGGQVVPFAANPAAGTIIGVFMGASWQDPIRGFVNAQFLPPGLTGVTKVKVKVADWPHAILRVQADGPVQLTQIGLNANLGNFTAGSSSTGNSAVNLASASIAVTATLPVRIYGLVQDAAPSPGAGSQPGDPFTDVLVTWNFGFDKYLNATGA